MIAVMRERLLTQPALLAQVSEEAGDRSRKRPAIVPSMLAAG